MCGSIPHFNPHLNKQDDWWTTMAIVRLEDKDGLVDEVEVEDNTMELLEDYSKFLDVPLDEIVNQMIMIYAQPEEKRCQLITEFRKTKLKEKILKDYNEHIEDLLHQKENLLKMYDEMIESWKESMKERLEEIDSDSGREWWLMKNLL